MSQRKNGAAAAAAPPHISSSFMDHSGVLGKGWLLMRFSCGTLLACTPLGVWLVAVGSAAGCRLAPGGLSLPPTGVMMGSGSGEASGTVKRGGSCFALPLVAGAASQPLPAGEASKGEPPAAGDDAA